MKQKILLPLILLAVCAITGCGSMGFFSKESVFNEIKNPDSYSIGAEKLNTTLSAEYELKAGDSVKVSMVVVNGEFEITIGADGDPIYEGNGVGLGDFTVNIPEDGRYTISVEGKKGEGSLSFEINRAE